MEEFAPYVRQLGQLVRSPLECGGDLGRDSIDGALDGGPSAYLRRSVSQLELRARGVFFTGSGLAQRVVKSIPSEFIIKRVIIDPACGAGDLLLACARRLALGEGLAETLSGWGTRLCGFDVEATFIRAARYRLALLAIQRGNAPERLSADQLLHHLPRVKVADGIAGLHGHDEPSLVIINPPYTLGPAPLTCSWGRGKVSEAAVFLDRCLDIVASDTEIVAILPDVLRTGSRYEKWRIEVEKRANVRSAEIIGRFDKHADVDVFVLRAAKRKISSLRQRFDWRLVPTSDGKTIGDFFEVHVGPVVPHRHEPIGQWRPYIHARGLPKWKLVASFDRSLRFDGCTFRPPFVVVRRTSSPGDKSRCTGTIIGGRSEMAVENHLLVLVPRDGRTETCRRLLRILRSARSTDWLNARIRCRHLTVSAIRELPW